MGLALRNERVRAEEAKNPTGYGAFLWLVALLKCRVLVKAAPKKILVCFATGTKLVWLVFRPAAQPASGL